MSNIVNFNRSKRSSKVAEMLQQFIDNPPERVAILTWSEDDDVEVYSTFVPGNTELMAVDTLLQTLQNLNYEVNINEDE